MAERSSGSVVIAREKIKPPIFNLKLVVNSIQNIQKKRIISVVVASGMVVVNIFLPSKRLTKNTEKTEALFK